MDKKNRSGTSRISKILEPIKTSYVSIEERNIKDLITYIRDYAKKVRFHKETGGIDFWSLFLDFTDEELQTLLLDRNDINIELSEFVEEPAVFKDNEDKFKSYTKPHWTLFFTFLKLLKYPKEKFDALSGKRLDFFYRDVLKLEEKEEKPDQVHLLFNLAKNVREHLVKKDTLLNAGKDASDTDLHYSLQDDVVINTAWISEIKTIHFQKSTNDIKQVHLNNDMGDEGFEKMLCLVLDNENLPEYTTEHKSKIKIDVIYLRTELYDRIHGIERDDLEKSDAEYIFNSLYFKSLSDFQYCLDLYYREMNRGYIGISYPEDQEWEEVYIILAEVHNERISRARRDEIRSVHKEYGFDAMMEYLFGEPEPWNMLYKFPGNITTLDDLYLSQNDAARKYIEIKLCMELNDFKVVIEKHKYALTSIYGEEVYTILERAWTKKRDYKYPAIGEEVIEGYYADTIFSEEKHNNIERFQTFGKSLSAESSENITMGFAIASPLLQMHEGKRNIEMVISCKQGTIDYEKITDLLKKDTDIFNTYLSIGDGFRETNDIKFEIGKFITRSPLKSFKRENSRLVCDAAKYFIFDGNCAGKFILFKTGSVYKIDYYDEETRKIYLVSLNLKFPADENNRIVSGFIPQNFISELKTSLDVDSYAFNIKTQVEVFSQHFEGKYFVDDKGRIFLIKKFLNASEADIEFYGNIPGDNNNFTDKNKILLNKVWEKLVPEYTEFDKSYDINGIDITQVSYSDKNFFDNEFIFNVTDSKMEIVYPEGKNSADLIAAWKTWCDNPVNDKKRFELIPPGNSAANLIPVQKTIEKTGEIIKRYDSVKTKGLLVTYRGRQTDKSNLIIEKASIDIEHAEFLIAAGTLIITPGSVSQTANQITADWELWLEETEEVDGVKVRKNDPKGFQIKSKDDHEWNTVPVEETSMSDMDKQIKKCEITNLYGNGIRVWYIGAKSDKPRVMLEENIIDLFEFVIDHDEHFLTIKYPSQSKVSAYDLFDEWENWKTSEVNDPGTFDIEVLGHDVWEIEAETEMELHDSVNGIIEVNIDKAGLIAMFQISDEYDNAEITFTKNTDINDFKFEFPDATSSNPKTKLLKIFYTEIKPPVPELLEEYKIKHVQKLLSKWNREYKKHGFILKRMIDYDDETNVAKWNVPDDFAAVNFRDNLNFVRVINPDGFKVKFIPANSESGIIKASVIISENNHDSFAFDLKTDYVKNQRILHIKYPQTRKLRTVEKLTEAWKIEENNEFVIEQSGSGKWEIKSVTEVELKSENNAGTSYYDPVQLKFYEYKTEDINGFNVYYKGNVNYTPSIHFIESTTNEFKITIEMYQDDVNHLYSGNKLIIEYPGRKDKRKIVDLLKTWAEYKRAELYKKDQIYTLYENFIIGYEIIGTSDLIEKRPETELLLTGDYIREYNFSSGDGISVIYTGHRDNVELILEERQEFSDDDINKRILWENGDIYLITDKFDNKTVYIEPAGNIEQYNSIKLYDNDAICLDAMRFQVSIDENFPAVLPLISGQFSEYPVIKILLDNTKKAGDISGEAIYYEYFKSICMESIDLYISVKGISDIKMRGELTMINPANPFNPFGFVPRADSRFYLANREICEKKINSLNINLKWAETEFMTEDGLPDMGKHYYAYSHCGLEKAGTIKNDDFEINLQFLDNRTWIDIYGEQDKLLCNSLIYNDFNKQTFRGTLFSDDKEVPKDPREWSRYYKAELKNQGFMKELYKEVSNQHNQSITNLSLAESEFDTVKKEIKARDERIKAARIAEAEAREKGDDYYPQVIPDARDLPLIPENDKDISRLTVYSPYTPSIQSMTIDYTASSKIMLDNSESGIDDMPVEIYRFHPFGFKKLGDQDDTDDYLLPQYDNQGYFMIGLKELNPGQSISLLFQMISGSGKANISMPGISWSYLAFNEWKQFKDSQIIKDMTFGLQDTGIIRFNIPDDATSTNTVMPVNMCWIRAEVLNNLEAFPDILDIKPQAVLAEYVNIENDPGHLDSPLAAETIKTFKQRESSVKEIIQPYSSFNGMPRENTGDFNIRISERLKHKNRALTLDDYEKLILNEFPQIYKVKCLPQDELEIIYPEARGEIIIVVIFKNKNMTPFYPLKPKTPANIIIEIEDFIKTFMPPLVNVKVKNPRFEEIKYRLAVKFKQGYDKGYHINKLNDDIKSFLSPWAYKKDVEISFGSSVYSSSVINFIENTDYVDYVANFTLLEQIIEHETYIEKIPLFLTENNAADVKYPDSILISADEHIIDVITTDLYDAGAFRGIGYMKIGTDFWIARPGPVFSVGIGEMQLESWALPRYCFKNINFSIDVTAVLNSTTYNDTDFPTGFSRYDSQIIWITLMRSGYIDEKGNVLIPEPGYFSESFEFKVKIYEEVVEEDEIKLVFKEEITFEKFLENNWSEFRFSIKPEDFDDTVEKINDFSYTVQPVTSDDDEIKNITEEVLEMLITSLGFDGRSQFPFIIY